MLKLKKKITKTIISIVVVVVLALSAGVFIYSKMNEPPITDTNFLISTLEKSSDLTTAKLNYKGFTFYTEENGARFISKSSFLMTYDATVRAGIVMSDVIMTADDTLGIIDIRVPKATIQNVDIIESSIEILDEDFVMFDFDQYDDMTTAITDAEKDAEEKITTMGILKMADTHAIALIKDIIMPLVPDDYTIEITQIEN